MAHCSKLAFADTTFHHIILKRLKTFIIFLLSQCSVICIYRLSDAKHFIVSDLSIETAARLMTEARAVSISTKLITLHTDTVEYSLLGFLITILQQVGKKAQHSQTQYKKMLS